MARKDPVERFHRKYKISEVSFYNGTPCWEWIACKASGGYVQIWIGHKVVQAHRFSYEQFVGPIQDGLTIDHLCRMRHCVNPSHLEAVPIKINTLRGTGPTAMNAKKTHCIHGHALSGDNLYVYPDGGRECVACRTFYVNRWKDSHPGYMKEYLRQWKTKHKQSKLQT